MSIKYYHLAKDEELPDEFCAVRDVGGEPSEYMFYVPEAENVKLRELVRIMHSELVSCEDNGYICGGHKFDKRVSELGVEVSE